MWYRDKHTRLLFFDKYCIQIYYSVVVISCNNELDNFNLSIRRMEMWYNNKWTSLQCHGKQRYIILLYKHQLKKSLKFWQKILGLDVNVLFGKCTSLLCHGMKNSSIIFLCNLVFPWSWHTWVHFNTIYSHLQMNLYTQCCR